MEKGYPDFSHADLDDPLTRSGPSCRCDLLLSAIVNRCDVSE